MIIAPETLRQHAERMAAALTTRDIGAAARAARHVSPARGALLLTDTVLEDAAACLAAMPERNAGRILGAFPPDRAVDLLLEHGGQFSPELLEEIPVDRAAAIARRATERGSGDALLEGFPTELRQEIQGLVQYDRDAVGALMTPRFLAVSENLTVAQALEVVAEAPRDVEHRAYLYVLDAEQRLAGVGVVTKLLGVDPQARLGDVVQRQVVAARVDDPATEAARILRHRGFQSLPVVDADHRPVGVLTLDDAMHLATEEVADSFTRVGAASEDENFFTPPMGSVRRRLPWMGANVFLNLGAVAVIASFEDTIMQVAILAAFLPMITDMGGNVGIQALSVAIRSIALAEARLSDYWKATRKEVVIGLVNGAVLGTLFAVIAFMLESNPWLGLVAGIALGVNVLVAGVIGGTLPFVIKRMGGDPAMMTGPVLTTITDITGVTIYLGLSTLFLTQILAF